MFTFQQRLEHFKAVFFSTYRVERNDRINRNYHVKNRMRFIYCKYKAEHSKNGHQILT